MDELQSCLAAIELWESKIQAFVDWNKARAIGRATEAVPSEELPLAGWSVAVKDVIDVAGMPTKCNAEVMPSEPVNVNAVIVDKLLAKGAFVMSKAVTTSFAYGDTGPTRNPWNIEHTPGGSSSGSAASVAAGMARLAIGTQTVGSVIRPSAFCGLAGFKPTYGKLSIKGVFPFSPTVDTVGLIATTISDVQMAFAAVRDEPVKKQSTRSLTIGLVTDLCCRSADPDMIEAVQGTADRLLAAGHNVHSITLPASAKKSYDNHADLIAAEVAKVHQQLFEKHQSCYRPKICSLILHGQNICDARLKQLYTERKQTIAHFDELLSRYDLLMTPATPGAAPRGIDSTGDHRMNLLWTHVGLPVLTTPCALSKKGLPLGLQLIGKRNDDHTLLAVGMMIEKLIGFNQRPKVHD